MHDEYEDEADEFGGYGSKEAYEDAILGKEERKHAEFVSMTAEIDQDEYDAFWADYDRLFDSD